MCTVDPCRKWSVFDALIWTLSAEGAERSSTATSENARCACKSKEDSVGHTISPERRKPKNHRHAAAHSIIASRGTGCLCHSALMARMIGRVIGRRRRVLAGVAFFVPLRTYSTLGMACIAGFPKPRPIWPYRTAARYDQRGTI